MVQSQERITKGLNAASSLDPAPNLGVALGKPLSLFMLIDHFGAPRLQDNVSKCWFCVKREQRVISLLTFRVLTLKEKEQTVP